MPTCRHHQSRPWWLCAMATTVWTFWPWLTEDEWNKVGKRKERVRKRGKENNPSTFMDLLLLVKNHAPLCQACFADTFFHSVRCLMSLQSMHNYNSSSSNTNVMSKLCISLLVSMKIGQSSSLSSISPFPSIIVYHPKEKVVVLCINKEPFWIVNKDIYIIHSSCTSSITMNGVFCETTHLKWKKGVFWWYPVDHVALWSLIANTATTFFLLVIHYLVLLAIV